MAFLVMNGRISRTHRTSRTRGPRVRSIAQPYRLPDTKSLKSLSLEVPTAFTE